MKRIIIAVLTAILTLSVSYAAEKVKPKKIEASELTLVGKLFPDTPNPYHRVDTVKYKGFTEYENFQQRMSSGISVAFRTNSKSIAVQAVFGEILKHRSCSDIAARGFDLFVREPEGWAWAAANSHRSDAPEVLAKPVTLIENMDGNMREFLLYLPNFSEIKGLKIIVDGDAVIEKADIPFKGRICMFGSSFTHGTSTTRPGMTYPAQLGRLTGYQFMSLGCGGNSKLQPYFAEVLADVDADVFVFDSFSNPKASLIEERLFTFIDIIRKKHPETPLVFLNTIYRSTRRYNTVVEETERAKMEMAEKMMAECLKKYENVYWINTVESRSDEIETSADGTHPSDYGYYLMACSIKDRLMEIFQSVE